MSFTKWCILAALATIFSSCFDSDDHIFNEAETIEITIDASLAKSATPVSPSVKADTFHISDTVYFQTTITPGKVIFVQDYHWLMDGEYCSSEYNFKKQIEKPGHHKFLFVLKDHFGDLHYDSLDVWISDNPNLNDTSFIPAQGTQAIDPYETIYFTWEASTPGIKLAHHYRFTLSEASFANSESKFKGIDTIINEPHFIFHNKLNPLKKYNWTVQAFNEYNLASTGKIESSFYTKGLPREGSLEATVKITQDTPLPIRLVLQNSDGHNFKYDFPLSKINNQMFFDAIPAGKYKLTLNSDYPDFGIINKDVTIRDGFVTIMDNFELLDTIAPSILSTSGSDTIDFADTLRFIIKDGSNSIFAQNISVSLEGDLVFASYHKDSILTVILDENEKSWTYRILNVSVTDGSKNVRTKSFYISPSISWITTNSDTTIALDGSISMFIIDNNPFEFELDSLKFYNVTTGKNIISIPATKLNSFTAELDANLFEGKQVIRSTVIYTNGLVQSKDWTLYVEGKAIKEEE